ncbi:MAG: glycosyltransferase, partial [Planctomycetota bacterium]
DNGSGEDTLAALEKLRSRHPDSVEIVTLGRNHGVAYALNVGMRRARCAGFSWALTMDHDSVADPSMVESLLAGLARWPSKEKVLISAPVFVHKETMVPGLMVHYDGWKRICLSAKCPEDILTPTVVITSGNLVRIDLHEAIGGYDESLFVDYVDHDFCLRGRRLGLDIIVPAGARLYHSVGNPVSKRILGKIRISSNHSPFRRYTIGRNRTEMIRRYGAFFPGYAYWTFFEFFKDALAILFCETGVSRKLNMMGKGIIDSGRYFRGRGTSFFRDI